jgi:hypothetical protein
MSLEPGSIVHLVCQGNLPGNRFLNGRTTDGTIDLAPSADPPYTGALWQVQGVAGSPGAVHLRCLGDIDGPRFLDGRTADGSVGLAPTAAPPYTGTSWSVQAPEPAYPEQVTLQCLGAVVTNFKFLDGRTATNSVGLAPDTAGGYTGTRWAVKEVSTAQNALVSGATLGVGDHLETSIIPFALTMQGDGNLVLTRTDVETVLWASNTSGHPGATCTMQDDGNLVVYDGATALWASGTNGHPGARLLLQDDGNAVVYGSDQSALWSTGTVQKDEYPSAPSVVTITSGTDRIQVMFVQGTDKTLWVKRVGAPANTWAQVDQTPITSAPSAVSWGSTRIDVFARGEDGSLLHNTQLGQWSGWQSLGGRIKGAPSAVTIGSNHLDVFARGEDDTLVHTRFDGQWRGWATHGGQLASDPSSVYVGGGEFQSFAAGKDGTLMQRTMQGWVSLGGSFKMAPAAHSPASGQVQLAAVNTQGQLLGRNFENGAWSGWQVVATVPPHAFAPALSGPAEGLVVHPQNWQWCDKAYGDCMQRADNVSDDWVRKNLQDNCRFEKLKCEAEAAGEAVEDWLEKAVSSIGAWISANAGTIAAVAIVGIVGAAIICVIFPPAGIILGTVFVVAVL